MARGIIYLMSAPALDGVVKIGKTEIGQFESRMRGLERDGYRCQMLKKEFAIVVDDYDEKEVLLHELLAKSCIGGSELFALDKDIGIQLLSSLKGEIIYPKQSQEVIFNKATTAVEEKKIYDEQYHLNKMTNKSKNLYLEIKKFILSQFPDLSLKFKKLYISFYKNNKDVCSVEYRQDKLKFYINLRNQPINDPNHICEDVTNKGHWGNGDWRVNIENTKIFSLLPDLIKQSYNKK